jgi:hypothetical protein
MGRKADKARKSEAYHSRILILIFNTTETKILFPL